MASFNDKDRYFENKMRIDNKNFYVSNYFLDKYESNNFKILHPGHYIFYILGNEKETKISFSKNWKIVDNQDDFYLKNNDGYLLIQKKIK